MNRNLNLISSSAYILPGIGTENLVNKKVSLIINSACSIFSITEAELLSTSRRRDVVNARFACLFFVKEKTGWTITRVGKLFNRHHASVVHAMKKIEDIDYDPEFKKTFLLMKKKTSNL